MGANCSGIPDTLEVSDTNQDTTTQLKNNIDDIFETAKIDNDNMILRLYDSDYALFLSGSFSNKFLCMKTKLYNFFDTNNIAHLNHNEKNKIITQIKIYNHKITNNKYKVVETVDNDKKNIQIFIHKPIYFYNNIIDADVLYKKISFAKKEIFIPFDLYVIKKMEYKIKNFCQITEKLGVEKIKITYNSNFVDKTEMKMNIKSYNIKSNIEIKENDEKSDELSIILDYPRKNQNYAINLNKYDIKKQIMDEEAFHISNEEYLADIDLQYLIDSRCDNFITNYNTTFKISRVSEFEKSIFTKAMDYVGLELSGKSEMSHFIEITISIRFINIYDNVSIIDGTNINPDKYGLINLCNFIKEELKILSKERTSKERPSKELHIKKHHKEDHHMDEIKPYLKIKKFLRMNLKGIQRKIINTNSTFVWNNRSKLMALYADIILFNFNNEETYTLFYTYFKEDLSYVNYVNFRNIIMKGLNNYNSIFCNKALIVTKYFFTGYQVHDIYYQQYLLIEKVKKITQKCLDTFKENKGLKTSKKNNDIDILKEILEESFIKSYYYKYGIAYCKLETPNLVHESNVEKYEIFNDNISIQLNNDNYQDEYDFKEEEFEDNEDIVVIEMQPLNEKRDSWIENIINTIKSIIRIKSLHRIKELQIVTENKIHYEEIFVLIENIIVETIEYMNKKNKEGVNNYDDCSYEINGIFTLTRCIDMVKDMTCMIFNEYSEYEQFHEYCPNKSKYNKKLIEKILNDKLQNIISDLFYKKYTIEKLFSNYRFYKVYFTFSDFLIFIKHVDEMFGIIANEGTLRGIRMEDMNDNIVIYVPPHPIFGNIENNNIE